MSKKRKAIKADQDGNFDSPALQALQGVWDDYDDGKADQAEVLRVIGNVETYVRTQIAEMESAAAGVTVDAHDSHRVTILNGFFEHLSALEKMRRFFESGQDALIDEALEQLQQATNAMVAGFQGLLVESERRGLMGPDGLPQTTPNYIEVADAHYAWAGNAGNNNAFLATLGHVRDRHVAQYEDTVQVQEKAEQEEALAAYISHLDEVLAGIERNVVALDDIAAALEEGDNEAVERAMASFAQATVDLLKIQARWA